MGVCCGNNLEYPEIEEAPSIKALSDFFKEKRKDLPLEAKEIEDYLADKSNIPRKVDISYQTDENLQKRIQYLEHYGGVVDQVTEILDNNPNMNLDKAKAIVNELYNCYFLTFDPDNACDYIPGKLKDILKTFN